MYCAMEASMLSLHSSYLSHEGDIQSSTTLTVVSTGSSCGISQISIMYVMGVYLPWARLVEDTQKVS